MTSLSKCSKSCQTKSKSIEQKFIGKLLFFSGKSEETFNLIKSTWQEGMERIDKCLVRNETMLWIYKVQYSTCSGTCTNTVQYLRKCQGLGSGGRHGVLGGEGG